jgi:hypothetical protein
MRKAALFASGAQLLNAIYAIAPELFGIGRAPVSGQLLDQAFRWFIFVESFTLAVFFFLVFRSAALNIAGSAVRIASLVAASTLIIENMLPTLGTIQGAIAAANNSLGWKYHPLNQFAYVLGPTIPTLEIISLVVFLLLVFSRSSRALDRDPRPKASGVLSLASFAAATMSFIAVAVFLYSIIMAAQPIATSVFRLLLRFATLVSLLSFFFVFGVSQRRGKLSA